MTDTDITPDAGIQTHPHLATIAMEPANWSRFERAFEDQPEVRIIKVDRHMPDAWMVHAACASREVRDLLESNW